MARATVATFNEFVTHSLPVELNPHERHEKRMKLQTKFPAAAIIAAAMATTLAIAPTSAAKAEGASTASELSALPLASIVVAGQLTQRWHCQSRFR